MLVSIFGRMSCGNIQARRANSYGGPASCFPARNLSPCQSRSPSFDSETLGVRYNWQTWVLGGCFLILLLSGWAWAAQEGFEFSGHVRSNFMGWATLRDREQFERFVAAIPLERVQAELPAPSNPDPILKAPPIDFGHYHLVAVYTGHWKVRPHIEKCIREKDDLLLKVRLEVPANLPMLAAPKGIGQYHMLSVEPFPGELRVETHQVDVP